MTIATIIASADTRIDAAFQTTNFGGSSIITIANIWLDGNKWSNTRAIGMFDLSGIPAGATINSALLRQDIYHVQIGNAPAAVYRLTRDDVEELAASWNNYKTLTAWTTGGAAHNDDDHTLTDKVTFTFPASTGVFDIEGMKTLVEDAIANRSDELHVLIHFDDELEVDPNDSYWWRSREYGTEAERWRLVVEYTEAAPPTPPPTPAQEAGHRDTIPPSNARQPRRPTAPRRGRRARTPRS